MLLLICTALGYVVGAVASGVVEDRKTTALWDALGGIPKVSALTPPTVAELNAGALA